MSAEGLFLLALMSGIMVFIGFTAIFFGDESSRRRRFLQNQGETLNIEEWQLRLSMILSSIRDLDFDYDMGKISDLVYGEQRRMLLGRAVSVLRRLDEVEAENDALNMEIENLIESYRYQADMKVDSALNTKR